MSKSLQQLIDTQKYALQTIPLASSTPTGKECEDVQYYLRQSYSDFDTNFVTILTYAKEIGYLRIFNDINQMGFNFKRNLHFNFLTIPNYSSTQLRSDLTNTIQNQITSFSEQNYLNYISNLSVTDDYEISRGHDVVRILVTIIKRNSNRNIQKKSFSSKLRDHYSENSFYSSQLFQSIRTYCDTIHKEIW